MADITLSYKGSTIATMSASGSKTIQTEGKYCEDDISLAYISANPNDTSEPALPAVYKRLEYLDYQPSIGILVGLAPVDCMMLMADFMSRKATGQSTAAGYRQSSTNSKDFQIGADGSTMHSYVRGSSDGVGVHDNASYTLDSRVTGKVVLINPRNQALLGKYADYQGSTVAALDLDGRIYQVRCVNLDTFGICNWFVPCRKVEDGTLGFFDHVTQIFYSTTYSESGTTATITAGPDVN